MAVSLFKDLITRSFAKVAKAFYEKINGSKEEPKYLHDQILTPEYSADMSYESISGNYSRVTADVVAFDSPLPLKKRGSIRRATGLIPKIGLKYTLNEKQMNTLRILKSMSGRAIELARKVFADTESCIYGIKETIEQALLIGLSSGVTLIKDENNVGTGIRIDYNIPTSNQFGVVTKWDDANATPIDDIRRVVKAARAKGETPMYIWLDDDTLDLLINNTQVRQSFAFGLNFTGTNIPAPSQEQMENFFERVLKLKLMVIDRSFVHEKDGVRTVTKGWTPNMVVFTTSMNVGSLVYSTLAEEDFPVEGVQYAKPNDYILISKSGTTDPVSEKTAGQALVIPVLQNVDSLFYLNAIEATASEDTQTEGDAVYTYKGVDYTKQSVVDGINAAGETPVATISQQDATLAKKIDALSEEGIALFEAELVESV